MGSDSFILDVPYRSQYDSSPYQNSNCGPAALAMVLQAYGLNVPNEQIRAIANQLQGTTSYNDGIALDYLQAIARQAGLRTEGLIGADSHYQQWTMADVIREVRRGYPVITLVHYASLPAHAGSLSASDHYVVVVGLTQSGFVINDPASADGSGFHQLLGPAQLLEAWRAASIRQQAIAFLPPPGAGGIHQIEIQLRGADARPSSPTAAQPPAIAGPPTLPPSGPTSIPPPPPPAISTDLPVFDPNWLRRASSWQHAQSAPTVSAQPASSTDGTTMVLAERQTASAPFSTTLLVILGIGAIALAILKAPNGEDQG